MAEQHTEWTPFVAGEHCRPAYYRPVKANPRIDPEADVEDVVHAFGVDCPRVAEAVRKLLRAGRKPGEPRAKEIAKACETLQRELSYLAMEPAAEPPPSTVVRRGAAMGKTEELIHGPPGIAAAEDRVTELSTRFRVGDMVGWIDVDGSHFGWLHSVGADDLHAKATTLDGHSWVVSLSDIDLNWVRPGDERRMTDDELQRHLTTCNPGDHCDHDPVRVEIERRAKQPEQQAD